MQMVCYCIQISCVSWISLQVSCSNPLRPPFAFHDGSFTMVPFQFSLLGFKFLIPKIKSDIQRWGKLPLSLIGRINAV